MSLDSDDVKAIARLARLKIDDADVSLYATNLSNILDLVAEMDAVDTGQVAPMAHPLEMAQRLREDLVTEPAARERYQKGAPAVENGLFLVPKVIE